MPKISIEGEKHKFSEEVQKSWDKLQRPTGEVGLLIGSEVAHIHPIHHETVGSMTVKRSSFGSECVLNGASGTLSCDHIEFDKNVQILRGGCYRSNKIQVTYNQRIKFATVEEYLAVGRSKAEVNSSCDLGNDLSQKEFMRGEYLGCEPPRRCSTCRGCKECGFWGNNMSQKEALELRMIEDNIEFYKSIGKWRVGYPFIQDPKILKKKNIGEFSG